MQELLPQCKKKEFWALPAGMLLFHSKNSIAGLILDPPF
jgi:hypothetical protein